MAEENVQKQYKGYAAEYSVPQGSTEIEDLTFAGCDKLERLIIPDSVTIIGNYAFMNCYSLKEVIMPECVSSIGAGLFQNCWQLRKLKIPEGAETLGSDMFENCHELAELTLPSTLKNVQKTAFSRCRSLKSIHIDPSQLKMLPPSARYTAALTFMEEHAADDDHHNEAAFAVIDAYVRERQNSFLDLAVNRRSTDAVRYMIDHGLVTPESLRTYLNRSVDAGRTEITALMLDRLGELQTTGEMEADPFL